jgi:hypothetical protein
LNAPDGPDDDFDDGPDDGPDDEAGTRTPCPSCDGDGTATAVLDDGGRLTFDCPECGGTGWL